MKISMLQRRAFLAVPLFGILLACAAARAAQPSGAQSAAEDSDTPAASAAAAASENSDWQDQSPPRRHRHSHGEGGDVVNIGHDSTLPQGQKSDSVVSVFGSSSSEGETDDVVAVFGDTRATGIVHDNVVSVFGNVYIDGKLEGDAVAVLGNMELGPHAEIDGDVFAIGGTLRRDPAAIVHGGAQDYFALDFGGAGWLRTWIHHCLLYGRPLALVPGLGWAWGLAFSFLALYAALALLFRDGITRCVQTFESQPGQSVLAALMAMLLTPVLVVLLFVTVIGIAAVPFVVFGLFCAGLFGKAVMLAWLGRRVTDKREGPMSHPVIAVLIGGVLVTALYLIPVLGFIIYKLLGVLGLGAVVYTLILAARAHHAAKEPPRPVPPAGAAPASALGASAASSAAPAAGASAASSA
ncbi:MAG TPA: polymer-forming cytoskeletal protein, partial [Steroidobacteraceae bacterium]